MTVCNQNRVNCGLINKTLESKQNEEGSEDENGKKHEGFLNRLMKANGCSLSTDTHDITTAKGAHLF